MAPMKAMKAMKVNDAAPMKKAMKQKEPMKAMKAMKKQAPMKKAAAPMKKAMKAMNKFEFVVTICRACKIAQEIIGSPQEGMLGFHEYYCQTCGGNLELAGFVA